MGELLRRGPVGAHVQIILRVARGVQEVIRLQKAKIPVRRKHLYEPDCPLTGPEY